MDTSFAGGPFVTETIVVTMLTLFLTTDVQPATLNPPPFLDPANLALVFAKAREPHDRQLEQRAEWRIESSHCGRDQRDEVPPVDHAVT